MDKIQLNPRSAAQLKDIAQRSLDGRLVRRAQALLSLAAGMSVQDAARHAGLSRQAIYKLAWRFESLKRRPVVERISDVPGRGRSAGLRESVASELRTILAADPQAFGYHTTCWTVPMMRAMLRRRLKNDVSDDTIRRALKQLGFSYKRPRFVLSRQSPTWRQAKGGFVAA